MRKQINFRFCELRSLCVDDEFFGMATRPTKPEYGELFLCFSLSAKLVSGGRRAEKKLRFSYLEVRLGCVIASISAIAEAYVCARERV